MRVTRLEISKENFRHNIAEIKKYVKDKTLIPIIKASGYGTFINRQMDLINEFSIVGVALVSEAVELRKLGYQKEILVINQPAKSDLVNIYHYDITIGLSCVEFLDCIDRDVKVHLEIETGMNRTGIALKDLDSFMQKVKKNPHVNVEGVYTHLSSADFDEAYTLKQIGIFHEAVKKVQAEFPSIRYIHCNASNGLLNYPQDFTTAVRPGIIMYGYESYPGVKELLDIKPVAKLKSEITFLKTVEAGEAISYSQTYKTTKTTRVATVPMGYADGIRRSLSNKGSVVIRSQRCPIIGTVCMDSFMVDVTDLKDVAIGDAVYLFDNELITLEEVAEICGTINYEILCGISERVERVMK